VSRPGPDDVREAAEALRGLVIRTPVLRSDPLDQLAGRSVLAKAECLQVTGSFKARGALNRVRTLSQEQRDAGLITISAGNAALGAAHAARHFGCRLTVVMPAHAVPEKLAAVKDYGATVVNDGVTSATIAFDRAAQLQQEQHLTLVHPFDDPMVVAGAATATLELLEDHPDLQRLYVPCSGGGPLAGAVLAKAATGSSVELVGVQPTGNDSFVRSLAAGEPTAVPHPDTVADGLTAPKPGALNFAIIRDAGVPIRTVTDEQILDALAHVARTLKVVVEPAGATALAGLLADSDAPQRCGVVLTGSNVNWQLLAERLTRNGAAAPGP
jgi:threonine dehydratase